MAGRLANFIPMRLRFVPFYLVLFGLYTLLVLYSKVSSSRRRDPLNLSVDVSIELSLLDKQLKATQQRLQSTRQDAAKHLETFASLPMGTVAFAGYDINAPKDPVLAVVVGQPSEGVHVMQPLEFEDQTSQLDTRGQTVLKLAWGKDDCWPSARGVHLMAGDFISVNDPIQNRARLAMVVVTGHLWKQGKLKVRWQAQGGLSPIQVSTPLQAVCFQPVRPAQQFTKQTAVPPALSQVAQVEQMANKADDKNDRHSHVPFIQGPARFAIISFANAHLQELQNRTWSTVAHYCAIHGYTAEHVTPSQKGRVPIHFAKYSEILQLFDKGYEWIVWLDADVVITNPNVTLESIINAHSQSTTNLIIGRDPWSDRTSVEDMWCPINSGVFFLRVSPWARRILELIGKLAEMKAEQFISFPEKRRFDPGGLVDQPILTQVLALEDQIDLSPSQFDIMYRTEYHQYVSIVPQRVMNSALRRGSGYNDHPETMWKPGDWVVHVTGEKNQSIRISYLNYALEHANDPPTSFPTISDSIALPPEVDEVVHEFSDLLQSTTISTRQAQLIGTTIHNRAKEGPLNVLVWGAAQIGAHSQIWERLNPTGDTTFLVDRTLTDGPQLDAFQGKVHKVRSFRTANSDRGDKDLALATSVPCLDACVAAHTHLVLLPPQRHWHNWDVIIIDDPLATDTTNQMIYTAALLALGPPNHTTDIFVLNAEHRMLRRYSDAFLGTRWLYNTHACPSPSDTNCTGSYMMHWRVTTGDAGKQVAEVFRTIEASWGVQLSNAQRIAEAQKNYLLRGGGDAAPRMLCQQGICRFATEAD